MSQLARAAALARECLESGMVLEWLNEDDFDHFTRDRYWGDAVRYVLCDDLGQRVFAAYNAHQRRWVTLGSRPTLYGGSA